MSQTLLHEDARLHIGCLTRITLGHPVKGGMEVHVDTLARGLVRRGHAVTVVTSGHPGGIEREDREGVRTWYLPDTPPGRYSDAWGERLAPFLCRLHREQALDVIWGEGAGAYYYLRWHRNPLRLPVVTFLQGTYLGELGTVWALARWNGDWPRLLRFLPWRTIQYFRWDLWYTHGADAVIASSRENAALARWGYALPRRKVVASVNGVDVMRFRPDPDAGAAARRRLGFPGEVPVLLHCSRLEPEKGAQFSVRATAEVRRRHPTVRLVVAGDGSQREELRRLAQQLDVSDAVHYVGHVANDELPGLYNAATMLLYPTLAVESFGIAVAEAMACARPVVAFRRGGIKTSIDHGATGFLVAPGAVDSLGSVASDLLDDPATCARVGLAARAKAERALSAERMVEDMLAVLHRVTAGRRARTS